MSLEIKQIQVFQLSLEELSTIIKEAVASGLQNLKEVLQPNPKPETEILSREQTKDLLGVSNVSLWKYNKDGLLKAKKVKGRVFYLRQDINDMLNQVA